MTVTIKAVAGHMDTQPGLHAHSFSAEDNLMQRYIVWERFVSGWVAQKSFSHYPTRRQVVNALYNRSNEFKISEDY